jgi:hypothetical protein
LRLSPNSKGPQHNEQAGSFLKAGVRQLPCDLTTGQSTSPILKSVYLRFAAGPVLLYDRVGDCRPENMRVHVDFKHYFGLGQLQTPRCTADDIEQKWENAGRVGRR